MRVRSQEKAQTLQETTSRYILRDVNGKPNTYGKDNEFAEYLLLRYYTAPELERVRRRQQDKMFRKMRGSRNPMPTAEESEENKIEELAAAVAGGKLFDLESKKEVDVTPEIAKVLLRDDLDLREDVSKWINDGQNFLQS